MLCLVANENVRPHAYSVFDREFPYQALFVPTKDASRDFTFGTINLINSSSFGPKSVGYKKEIVDDSRAAECCELKGDMKKFLSNLKISLKLMQGKQFYASKFWLVREKIVKSIDYKSRYSQRKS